MRRHVLIALALLLLVALPASLEGGILSPGRTLAVAPPDLDGVARLGRATAVNDADGDKVFDDLARRFARAPGTRLPVLVSFVEGTPPESGARRILAAAPEARVQRTFAIVPVALVDLTLAESLRVARLREVRQLELDHPMRAELDSARLHMGVEAVLDEMRVTADLDGDAASFGARDVGIAVLDGGIDGAHVDFAGGKIVHWRDFGGDHATPRDDDGHGTHVASIAAGLGGADASLRGVAPGAALIGVRLVGSMSTAIAAYEMLVEKRAEWNVRVATMSLGYGPATDGTTALERAVDRTWQAGIVTVKSAGNGGPEHGTLTVPGAARGVLTVGALVDPGGARQNLRGDGEDRRVSETYGFHLANFSGRGPTADGRVKPDVTAPGVAIRAAAAGAPRAYVERSGTSMAAPFVAGAAALVIAADPALSPDEVRDILFDTAEDWGAPGPDPDYGVGRVQVREAVREAFARAGLRPPPSTPPPAPYHETRSGRVTGAYAEGTFVVNDTANPVAATFLVDGRILAAEVRAPNQALVGHLAAPVPGRQQTVGFEPVIAGTYTFRLYATPGSSYVVDVSHGVVPALPSFAADPLEGSALAREPARTPAAGPVVLVAFVALAAWARPASASSREA